MEIWLRNNARAMLFGMAPPLLAGLAGIGCWLFLPGNPPLQWLRIAGLAIGAGSLLLIVALAWQTRQPRLAYRDGRLLIWLRSGAPLEVPIEFVECFWLGQAPSLLPGKRHEKTQTAAVVIRLAERADQWRRVEVRPALGSWCDGYVTIRGTWCEPLSVDLVNRLNHRLAEVASRSSTSGERA